MKKIRLAYVDFWKTFNPEEFVFTKILRKHYSIIWDDKNPDFIFCSNFGNEYLNYACPRIMFLGEAKAIDFNVYDYGIAFDDISYGDRYIQYPLFLSYEKNLELALKKHTYSDAHYLMKKRFCNTVVSNKTESTIRDTFFEELSKYKQVDSGGKHLNNLPDGQPVRDKLEFQRKYRFSLAFENSSFPGYVTEKIIDAWAAETIPIYWGASDVASYFNPKAFINCSENESIQDMIQKVIQIEECTEDYLAMMKEPILVPGCKLEHMLKPEYLEDFLLHIFEQEPKVAFRRQSVFTMWGKSYEHHLKQWKILESKKLFQVARNMARKLKK